jgi:hypothetical protein
MGGGADLAEVTIEGINWEYTSELALLDEAMEMTTQVFRGEETKKMINAIDVGFCDIFERTMG